MKLLKYEEGNLLTHKGVDIISHQANCQNIFGSGIARSIREMYPEAYKADCEAHEMGREVQKMTGEFPRLLGKLSVGEVTAESREKWGTKIKSIYNLYGQNLGTDYSKLDNRKTNYEALYSALERMRQCVNDSPSTVVGFPYLMGSALGGGNWNIVSRLIEVAFDGFQGEVLIVKLAK